MNNTGATKAKSVLLIALVVLCLACALVILAPSCWFSASFVQLWRGYYTVLVSGDVSASAIQDRLRRAGLSAITAENSLVRFDDFSSEASVPVGELASRFDSLDPRYDPYMRAVGAYFHTGLWNIFYVRISGPPPVAVAALSRALYGVKWKSADLNRGVSFFCLTLLAFMALAVLFRTRRPRAATLALLAGLLPWLPAALNGSFAGTLAGSLLYLGWSSVLDLGYPLLRYYLDYRVVERGRLIPIGGILLSMLFAASVLSAVDPRLLESVIRGSAFLVSIGLGLAVYELWRRERRQHRLFFPLRILTGARTRRLLPTGSLGAAWIALLLLASPAIAFVNWSAGVDIPTPVVYPGVARNSWDSLGRIWQSGSDRGLPNLADYVAHRAYQAGLSFGESYSFPMPGERVYERHYSREGNRVVNRLVVVKVYSRAWFRRILTGAGGVVRLIEDQPGVIVPTRRPLYDTGYPKSYLGVFWLVTLAVFLPSTFLRRGEAFQTVGRTAGMVSVLPPSVGVSTRRLPTRPRRRRVLAAQESRDLVSDAVSDGER